MPDSGQENMTLRERLDAHREHESCKGCHAKIDPFGFALENYGPTGIWRDEYENGRKVDSSGVLFRKHKFDNPVAFELAQGFPHGAAARFKAQGQFPLRG